MKCSEYIRCGHCLLIDLLELYDVRCVVCKDYFVCQKNCDDLLVSLSNDLLKYCEYQWYSKLHCLVVNFNNETE